MQVSVINRTRTIVRRIFLRTVAPGAAGVPGQKDYINTEGPSSVKVHLAGSILPNCCHHCLRGPWECQLDLELEARLSLQTWTLETGEDWHSPLYRGRVGGGEASAWRPGHWRGLTLTSVSVTRGSLLRVFWVARTSTVADSGQGQDRGLWS